MQVLHKQINRVLKVAFKKRKLKSNKADYGKVLIIGGSKKYLGAGILASLAATKSGAGYTYLMSDLKKVSILKYPDFILSDFSLNFLKDKKKFSIGFGPGVGLEKKKFEILKYLISNKFEKVVLDADGLTLLANIKGKIQIPKTWVLTPHEGEMLRLLNKEVKITEQNRVKLALDLQKKYGCHILLKGNVNIFIDSDGKVYLGRFGHPALAKAGSGDVLTGLLTNQLNYQKNALDAMIAASYIHGKAAKSYLKLGYNERSMRPIDLIEELAKLN